MSEPMTEATALALLKALETNITRSAQLADALDETNGRIMRLEETVTAEVDRMQRELSQLYAGISNISEETRAALAECPQKVSETVAEGAARIRQEVSEGVHALHGTLQQGTDEIRTLLASGRQSY